MIASVTSTCCFGQSKNLYETIIELVKKLEQEPASKKIQKLLVNFYNNAEEQHLQKINDLQENHDHLAYEQILKEYTILQSMYETVEASAVASQIINAPSYKDAIASIRQIGAADSYREGDVFLTTPGRLNKTKAYNAFKRAQQFEKDYKDSKEKMEQAWKYSHLSIMIDAIKDSFTRAGDEDLGENHLRLNKRFEQAISRKLLEKHGDKYNTYFYSSQNNLQDSQQPNWVVHVSLVGVNFPAPSIFISTRNVVTGTEFGITRYSSIDKEVESHAITGKISVTITDAATGELLSKNLLNIVYKRDQSSYVAYGDRINILSAGYDPSNMQQQKFSMTPQETDLCMVYEKYYPEIEKIIVDAISK
jgi:hypothetical protein